MASPPQTTISCCCVPFREISSVEGHPHSSPGNHGLPLRVPHLLYLHEVPRPHLCHTTLVCCILGGNNANASIGNRYLPPCTSRSAFRGGIHVHASTGYRCLPPRTDGLLHLQEWVIPMPRFQKGLRSRRSYTRGPRPRLPSKRGTCLHKRPMSFAVRHLQEGVCLRLLSTRATRPRLFFRR